MQTTHLKHLRTLVSLSAFTLAFALNSPAFAADNNLAGTWKATFTARNGQTIESTLKLKQDGDKLSGVVIGRNGNETPLDEITLAGDQLSLKFTRERNGEKVAAYRDPSGAVTLRSAICTHMGCVVGWNAAERTWDCPCHGSRFKPTGDVISGPAETPLPKVE